MTLQTTNRALAHYTWTEVKALEKDPGVVVLPVGAFEQHGPHLPLSTDTLLATHVLNRTLESLPASVRAWMLPPLNYSKSNEHAGFPGTIALSSETLLATLHDIASSLSAAGFRRLAFFNGHGGNVAVLDAAARDILDRHGLHCFCLHPALYVEPPFAISEEEARYGFHAGELETSLMLAIRPDLVHPERAERHIPAFEVGETSLHFFGSASAAWLTRDWSPSGVFGDAAAGTAEKGEQLLASAVTRLSALIEQISRFEPGESRQKSSYRSYPR
jgi:creatinine amidohydrolase/Fe(II)-dependent formamide hydrolase-like protein